MAEAVDTEVGVVLEVEGEGEEDGTGDGGGRAIKN
jgi:hypothetical protein